ncbi:peptidoglycan DD-metalloendopeptidase family protein [uncultured Desulfuromonas sp.]|uniref:peptidoglycan DD-metalloendopeptidase family protein n=1 Tax=uncultured Desulfuromonas sp. TaxID=181013 RepID=UPI002AABB034|nr:peptidoglycan DD-metalloendopeptidase family protein [uncultured Desulfuromonas sp.]
MATSRRQRKQNTTLLLVLASAVLVVYILSKLTSPSAPTTATDSTLPAPAAFHEPAPEHVIQIQRETICQSVQPGDTITAILGHYFSPQEILVIARQSENVFPLSQLCAGHPYQIEVENESFVSFYYDINRDDQLIIRQEDGEFFIERQPIPYVVDVEQVGGVITSSLFGTVAQLGESSELAAELMNIFAWDIDFIRDIREGDYFTALVEKRYRDGNLAGYGDILAAEFNNQGKSFYAFHYTHGTDSGYYNQDGKSLRKAFLKAPLSYTRISSGYTRRRFHPVLNKWKPHLAIDYAAPTGTPIKAVADGTITQKSYDRNNGNKIRLRHPNDYETTYIHMVRFARGMKKGKRVKQGEVIGYVGSTGIATGPHLDFRVFHHGKPINPLKIKSEPAKPISKANRAEFDQLTVELMQQLTQAKQQLALLPEEETTGDEAKTTL